MHADKAFGMRHEALELGNRDPRGIARHDDLGSDQRIHGLVQFGLDLHPLGHVLDDEVGAPDGRSQVLAEADLGRPVLGQRYPEPVENARGKVDRPAHPRHGGRLHIVQADWNAAAREGRGDARPHGPKPDQGGLTHQPTCPQTTLKPTSLTRLRPRTCP